MYKHLHRKNSLMHQRKNSDRLGHMHQAYSKLHFRRTLILALRVSLITAKVSKCQILNKKSSSHRYLNASLKTIVSLAKALREISHSPIQEVSLRYEQAWENSGERVRLGIQPQWANLANEQIGGRISDCWILAPLLITKLECFAPPYAIWCTLTMITEANTQRCLPTILHQSLTLFDGGY